MITNIKVDGCTKTRKVYKDGPINVFCWIFMGSDDSINYFSSTNCGIH